MIFQDGGRRHFGFSQIRNFNGRSAVRDQYASLYQILSKSVKRLQRYGDLTVFSKWRSSAILHLLSAYWDHPRRPLDGLYRFAKFGWNRCSSFDNIKPFGWKTPIYASKIGVFGGFHTQNREQYQRSLCESTSFEPSSMKICWWVWPLGEFP